MSELRNTTKMVKYVLTKEPRTRNSDNLLWLEVIKLVNQGVLRMPMAIVLQNLKDYNLPSIETVGRCRRKIQAAHPELRAKAAVQDYRTELEAEFREWAGEADV